MRRPLIVVLVLALVAGGVAALIYGPLRAAEPKWAGTWKVVYFPPNGAEVTLWLIRIDNANSDDLSVTVLGAGQEGLADARPLDVRADAESLRLKMKVTAGTETILIPLKVYLPPDKAHTDTLRGMVGLNGEDNFAHLERSNLKALGPGEALGQGAYDILTRAGRTRDLIQRKVILQQVIDDHANSPPAVFAGVNLAGGLAKQGAAAEEIRKQADAAIDTAATHGPEMKRVVLAQVARQVLAGGNSAPLALEYARQAEKMLTDAEPPGVALAILKTLGTALTKTGDPSAAAKLRPRIDKLEDLLDRDYLKIAVPFQPKAFAGRKNQSERIVLVELFTGAQCGPCVAADVAFDALLQTYKPAEVMFLQYHLHVPAPDPMTNPDSEKRARFYDVPGTPSYYLDGEVGPQVGGARQMGKPLYDQLRPKIEEELAKETRAKLQLTVSRQDSAIDIAANFSGLEKPIDALRLRFVLIEDVVRYAARNGQRLHHHVVRAFPGGVEGKKLSDMQGKHTARIDLGELAKSLNDYLTAADAKLPFPDNDRPLSLKNLKVVAFIQDEETKSVLQASQVDVEEKK
jgi:hypothetical protein